MLARQAFYKFIQKYNSIQFVYYANKYIEIQTNKKYSLYPGHEIISFVLI